MTNLPDPVTKLLRSSNIALSVGDMTQEDCPLVAVNDRFCEITGYTPDDVTGRNCRFLQPPEGAGPVKQRMHDFIHTAAPQDEQFLVPNLRKDGTKFVNLVYMSKLLIDGAPALVLASQFDLSKATTASASAYAKTLETDVHSLREVLTGEGVEIVTSYPILANTTALIARTRLAY